MILRPEHNSKKSNSFKNTGKNSFVQSAWPYGLNLGSQGLPLYAGLTVHKIDLLAFWTNA